MKEITQTLLASPFPNDKIYPTNIALVLEGFKGLVIESLIPGNKSWQQLSVPGPVNVRTSESWRGVTYNVESTIIYMGTETLIP